MSLIELITISQVPMVDSQPPPPRVKNAHEYLNGGQDFETISLRQVKCI